MPSGGCQCGEVRYAVERFGRSSICHCRMCQKAFGNLFAPLVTAHGLEWTRGSPSRFDSSNRNWRTFCARCGTPLTYESEGDAEISVGSLDDPEQAPPSVQVNTHARRSVFANLTTLPEKSDVERVADEEWNAGIVSNQHPDHDT